MPIAASLSAELIRPALMASVDPTSTPQNAARSTLISWLVSTVDPAPELRMKYFVGSTHGMAARIGLPAGGTPPLPNTRCAASALIDCCEDPALVASTNGTTGPLYSPGMIPSVGGKALGQLPGNRSEMPISTVCVPGVPGVEPTGGVPIQQFCCTPLLSKKNAQLPVLATRLGSAMIG